MEQLKKKIHLNNEDWKVKLDRMLGIKQRTSRAESYGIHRLAQQPLMLYQPRNIGEEIVSKEKVIIVDDHIQAGAAIYCAATQILQNKAHLIAITSITAHKNGQFFNLQEEVKAFITSLLPKGHEDLPTLNKILKIIGLDLESLTNFEGMILSSILCDSKNPEHKLIFGSLLKKYDASKDINYSLFKNQNNSLMEEFQKPKVEFANFESELLEQ